ncbi:hypothetical protein ABEX38_30070 [Priestia megaterium]
MYVYPNTVKTSVTVRDVKTPYTYWEVFRYAEDKDVFEIIKSPVSAFEGRRVIMKLKDGYGAIMKDYGQYHNDSSDSLILPYGAVTGATFQRVEDYKEVDFRQALTHLKDGSKPVYTEDSDGEKFRLNMYDSFGKHEIYDFEDLLLQKYYIKE